VSDACLALAAGGGTQGAALRKFHTNLEEGRREGGREGGEGSGSCSCCGKRK